MFDIAIIGCGVIGAACAYELSKYNISVCVFEACNDVACCTSKANSGIVHAGFDAPVGSNMARLNVEGNALMQGLCERLDVPFKRPGSMVLSFDEEDNITLEKLMHQGNENGVEGLRLISGDEARALEPSLSDKVRAALLAPSAGIVSPWELTLALAETAVRNGAELYLSHRVTALEKRDDIFSITAGGEEFSAHYIINAAGVDAERVHALIAEGEYAVTPTRGEYFLLDKAEGERVNRVIFQCPGSHGKGVLVAPTVHGNLIVGPSAEAVSAAGDTENTASGMEKVRKTALRSVPSIEFRENIRNFAGVRANQSSGDFIIRESGAVAGMLELAGIKSPGLTAAPAIGLEALKWVKGKLGEIEIKENYIDSRRHIRFSELPPEEKARVVERNPLYGRVICRCETVTEGEIVDALHSPIPPVSINGVKRRTGAGMGRCQGGFCEPKVQEIISRELNIPFASVTVEDTGSYILVGETKGDGAK